MEDKAYEMDGRSFIPIEMFLKTFKCDEYVLAHARLQFSIARVSHAEERNEDVLLRELDYKCLQAGPMGALYSPIVTKDGWVFWTYSGIHPTIMSTLSALYSNGTADDPDDFIRDGHGWFVSSIDPRSIVCGKKYPIKLNDKRVFELFNVQKI